MLFEQLKIFTVVAEHLNITRASRELHLSQPAVSKHLRFLEETYELQLHRRNGKGIVLTNTGKRFLRHIVPIVSQIEHLKETFHASTRRGLKGAPAPILNVGVGHSPAIVLLPSLLSFYKKKQGSVEVYIHCGPTDLMKQRLQSGEVEVALLSRRLRSRQFTSELVREEKLVAFVRPCHPLARKPAVHVDDLWRFSFVIGGGHHGKSFSERAVKTLKGSGFSPRVSMRCESVDTIKTTVKTSNEIGILYRDAVLPEIRRGELVAIHPPGFDFQGQTFLIFPAGGPRSREAAAFIEVVRSWREKRPRCSAQGSELAPQSPGERSFPSMTSA